MKTWIMITACILPLFLTAQVPANNFVEGGKLLVELMKVIKKKPTAETALQASLPSDLCFINKTTEDIAVLLSFKISDTLFRLLPNSLTVKPGANGCVLDISPGVYHYKISKGNNIHLEGDMRVKGNMKLEQEVR